MTIDQILYRAYSPPGGVMTPQDLLEALDRAEDAFIEFWGAPDVLSGPATITLTNPRKREPRGETVRLFGRTGPKGQFLTCNHREDGLVDVTARYKISTLRAYIKKEMTK